MNAAKVAEQLKALGYEIMKTEEGDEQMDGSIDLNEAVSIQIPTSGSTMEVSRFDGEAFHHYGFRRTVSALKNDIDKALADALAHGPIIEKPLVFDVFCNGDVLYQIEAESYDMAQKAVDEDCTPNTCTIFCVSGNDDLRQFAIQRSRDLASASIAASLVARDRVVANCFNV